MVEKETLENAGERENMRNGVGDRRFALLSSVVKRICLRPGVQS